jgi:hypothetical protein
MGFEERRNATTETREPRKRAHSPQIAAGLASVSENGKLPSGRRFYAACCRESSIARIFLYYKVLKAIRMTPIYGPFFNVCQGEKGHMGFALIFEAIANILLRRMVNH